MHWQATRLQIQLRYPFVIARGTMDVAQSVLLTLEHDGVIGQGEAAPSKRYSETPQSVVAALAMPESAHGAGPLDPFAWHELLAPLPPAARCAFDIALHDWHAKRLAVSVGEYLGIESASLPSTSITIGISSLETVLARVREFAEYPIIKLKLGQGDAADLATVTAVRQAFRGILRLDANEAWHPEQAVRMLNELARFDIELCEQPIPAGSPAKLRWIRERVRIPLIADEDAKDARDVLALHGAVDGINIKLVKCGGIRGALEMIRIARILKMRVMLGCMVESSLCATAAAQLIPLVDYADIDGPLLIRDDPFCGVQFAHGRIRLPQGPGLGVFPREGSAPESQVILPSPAP